MTETVAGSRETVDGRSRWKGSGASGVWTVQASRHLLTDSRRSPEWRRSDERLQRTQGLAARAFRGAEFLQNHSWVPKIGGVWAGAADSTCGRVGICEYRRK